jgi:hypothetical protein
LPEVGSPKADYEDECDAQSERKRNKFFHGVPQRNSIQQACRADVH